MNTLIIVAPVVVLAPAATKVAGIAVIVLIVASLLMPTNADAQDHASIAVPATVFAVAQTLDWHSTRRAINSGLGREANPLMQVGSVGQAAIKVAISGAVIYLGHRLNRNHQKVAKSFVWALSAVTFTVAANNYRIGTPTLKGGR